MQRIIRLMDGGLSVVIKLSAFLLVCFFPLTLYAACAEDWVARVVSAQGQVDVREENTETWQAVRLQQVYCQGDTIRVQANSRAALELHNDTILRLNQNSTLKLSGPKQAASWLDLLKGSLHSISRVPHSLTIKTPLVNAGVDGTEFIVQVAPDNVLVGVIEGEVSVSNEYGRIVLAGDQTAITYPGKAPVLRLDIRPADSVQWSLYYPSLNVASLKPAEDLLHVGQVEAAEALLKGQDSADALALRSVIAIAANKKQEAIALAQQAVQADNASPAAYLSLSYARQANFDLPGAKKAAQQAVSKNPQHAIAWARLAELHLSLAELDEGLAAARRAAALEPELARTQSVLGFAHLLQYRTDKARRAFKRAIKLDSADPLARLGNGLATIREGSLKQGRREIEIAASLDTNNSLIRSYLGKAYLEENRFKVAADQFALAKQMDPKDPTPWLYDAIRKQGENDPIGALEDIQRSTELNNNRAVFRSSFELDQDLGVKSIGQAHIYQRLGLTDVAKNIAAESLVQSPDNYAAHRFLSDAYVNRSRHEIARSSELFQSRLLQPLGSNPVRPHTAETNLNISTIPASAQSSYNEYSSLYESEGSRAFFSATKGNFNLVNEEVVLSGLNKKWSYSLGQYHYKTNGFRDGADVKHDIYNVFLQGKFSSNLDVQFEYRDRETDQGDLRQYFILNPPPSESFQLDQKTFRLGGKLKFSNNSSLLFSLLNIDHSSTSVNIIPAGPTITTDFDRDGNDIQLQFLRLGENYNIVAGLGNYDIDSHESRIFDLGFFVSPPDINDYKFKQDLAYIYLNLLPRDDLAATLGFSYASLDRSDWQREFKESDPKFGLVWQASDSLKVRLGVFETLKRILLVNQTLEPTQVAGFNQFYDDANGANSRFVGLGMDVKTSNGWSYGLEVSERDIERPLAPTFAASSREHTEQKYSLYWGGSIRRDIHLSGNLDYIHYSGDLSTTPAFQLDDLRTVILPLTIKYIPNQKYSFDMTATHVRQKLVPSVGSVLDDDRDTFTLVDLAMKYQLSGRRGSFSLGVKNIFDKSFKYQDDSIISFDPFKSEARFFPERSIVANFLINLK